MFLIRPSLVTGGGFSGWPTGALREGPWLSSDVRQLFPASLSLSLQSLTAV